MLVENTTKSLVVCLMKLAQGVSQSLLNESESEQIAEAALYKGLKHPEYTNHNLVRQGPQKKPTAVKRTVSGVKTPERRTLNDIANHLAETCRFPRRLVFTDGESSPTSAPHQIRDQNLFLFCGRMLLTLMPF
jgi:hypothetical protein